MGISDDRQCGWFKSSFSSGTCSCVETRFDEDVVSIRDSKYLRDPSNDPALQPVISVTQSQWEAFIGGVILGDPLSDALVAERLIDGGTAMRSTQTDITLLFTVEEWQAFEAGVAAGEFQPRLLPN